MYKLGIKCVKIGESKKNNVSEVVEIFSNVDVTHMLNLQGDEDGFV